jgi:glucosamine-6-phosphate deaminase
VEIRVLTTGEEAGQAAARSAAGHLRETLRLRGAARIVAATGASQFAFLDALVAAPGIDWSGATMFHLDEYLGLPADHPASFRRYLRERLIDRVHPGAAVLIDGQAEPRAECLRAGALIAAAPIDLAFVGIGENGHLAFNDPPADFATEDPYIVVELDEACRRQQLGEGWFARLEDVPSRAISMSIRQILRARTILCIAPELRKAAAVRACLEDEVSPLHPASILRTHPDVELYLDVASASQLSHAAIKPQGG